jgi:hypothetical protein
MIRILHIRHGCSDLRSAPKHCRVHVCALPGWMPGQESCEEVLTVFYSQPKQLSGEPAPTAGTDLHCRAYPLSDLETQTAWELCSRLTPSIWGTSFPAPAMHLSPL